jgi:predicted DNA-binding protein (MmcQ/YjbR family)
MRYAWIDDYCLSMKGVVKEFKREWNATRYMIKDKIFVLQGGDKEGKPIVTVKLEPEDGYILRQQFIYIKPGYYMNKEHWNSLYLEGDVPDEIVRDMLLKSYNLVLASLSKKLQKDILEEK